MMALGVFMFLTGDPVGGIWLGFIGLFLSRRPVRPRCRRRSPAGSRASGGRRDGRRAGGDPGDAPAGRAEEEFFLRYGWPWFPVVDASGRLVGVVSREAVDSVRPSATSRPVASVMARDEGDSGLRVRLEDPLETLLSREGLGRLGAIMAVDDAGVLRGIVTVDRVRRALQAPA